MDTAILLFLGIAGGFASSVIGIGGGVVIVPALVLLLGYSQKMAQGTTLAMLLPPIGVLAVWSYYKRGLVNLNAALLLCLGFLAGSYIGAEFATRIDNEVLRKGFGLLLVGLGVKMFFG